MGLEHRKNNFNLYLKKTINRLINAFVYTKYDMDTRPSKSYGSLDPQDKEVLKKGNFVVKGNWACLNMEPNEFNSTMINLKIRDIQKVSQDWNEARNSYLKTKKSLLTIFRGLLMGIIATGSMIFLLFTPNRSNQLILSVIIFYVIYLLPYILVSHQLRYHRPLFAAQLILIYCATITIYQKLFPVKNSQTEI
jgi:hypothetical protein